MESSTSKLQDTSEPVISEFSQLSLRQNLLEALQNSGYLFPSPIQSRSIKPIIDGRDVALQAQKDTGKTSIFIIGLLQIIDLNSQKCQGLISTTSQEQAQNTLKILQSFGKYLKVSYQVYTEAAEEDIRDVQIIIGTLGDIYKGLHKGMIHLEHLKLLALDGVGTELSEELQEICRMKPKGCQMGICFENVSEGVEQIIKYYMEMPAIMLAFYEEFLLSQSNKYYYLAVDTEECKYETLVELCQEIDPYNCVVFCNDESVQRLVKKINEETRITVFGMDKSVNQEQKEITLRNFGFEGDRKMLITNDWLLNRDRAETDNMNIFIHYDFPKSAKKYEYRMRKYDVRSRWMISISFLNSNDQSDIKVVQNLENYYKLELAELPVSVR